ncbi:MAG TPA: molecular chaperone HtpG [Nannocystaceae bacterium]|nr:molecular chaperone HtpG [Nannocystaceae bacterium]
MAQSTPTPHKHEFKAEVSALLKLVTNSLYTNREIFLRELISNASDALDKARFEGLTRQDLLGRGEKPEIKLEADLQRGVLIIEDNGIGMSEEEATRNLGTIAHSGTLEFLRRLRDQQESGQKPDVNLIGQFGVGFYSAFMVADRIDVYSRSAHTEHAAVHWSSTGDGTFTTAASDRQVRGTRIELTLKEDATEFAERYRIEHIVRRYSNYVMHPITLLARDKDGAQDGDVKQVNEASAFWARSPKELTEDDYKGFYKHVMGGFVMPGDEPIAHLHFSADAPIQFHALLYVPGRPPADLFMEDRKSLQLFARRVMIMESCDKLLPLYLRFIRGVVDSEDLPLNVSREMLQEDRTLTAIRKQLTKKVLRLLADLAKDKPDDYTRLWKNFGAVLKEGIHTDSGHQEELVELIRFKTSTSGDALVSLADYVAAMPEGQDAIYYVTGDNADALARSPHLEACRARGYQVLFMTDAIDEWVVQDLEKYKDKPLRSVSQGDLDLPEENDPATEEAAKELAPALERAGDILKEQVKEVRVSKRLTESPSCLIDDEGDLSRNMERILKMANQQVPSRKRILEVNAKHPFVQAVGRLTRDTPDDPRIGTWIELLYDQAALAEGQVADPAGMVKRLQSVLSEVAART